MTWRLLYVPHVGHAVCGSLGLRQLGQVISWGAVAFHWARRDLVLLRDILRLGTATSVLLCLSRLGIGPVTSLGRPGCRIRYFFLRLGAVRLPGRKALQRGPHGAALLVLVTWLSIGQPDPALRAQSLAAVLAQRRERQLQHNRVPQRRLQVQQPAAVQFVAVGLVGAVGQPGVRI